MTYKEARVYLDEVSKYGSVLGLDTIRGLLCELGNPQDDLLFVHIAGTNGKGSVLAYTSAILSEAGLRTGRYISPTVLGYLERIQVNGHWIPEEIFAELVEEVQRAVARMEADGKGSPTVFEIETAIAFLYFRNMNCDVVVLETGLGGGQDATNVIRNTAIAAFATISRDHMGFLGNTLEEIAEEKAGIIKPGCVVVSAPQRPEVCRILRDKAEAVHCPILFAEEEQVEVLEESFRGQRISYKGMQGMQIGLAGRYQISNAITAWEIAHAWEIVQTMGGIQRREQDQRREQTHMRKPIHITEAAIRAGLKEAKWIGRFTCISEQPLFFIDGAHNEDAARRLRESIETYFPGRKLICIMGVFKDKEYEKIANLMAPCMKRVYTVNLPDRNRTLSAERLAQVVTAALERCGDAVPDSAVLAAGDVETAVKEAQKYAGSEDIILAFGSLSYLGAVIGAAGKALEADRQD